MAAANAERYYRAMVRGGRASWNVRDCHLADTLDRLLDRYSTGDDTPAAKAVVWGHNIRRWPTRHAAGSRKRSWDATTGTPTS